LHAIRSERVEVGFQLFREWKTFFENLSGTASS
jgi:hypothetical protein